MNYKDDDGQIDPMDELLDAYQCFLRMGMVEYAEETMALVHDLQNLIVGKERDAAKSHDMGYANPLGCLSQAYLGLVMHPEGKELAARVLALLGRAAEVVAPVTMPGGESENEDSETGGADGVLSGGGDDDYRSVRREIREEESQFCVYSETGRAFGCYASRDRAEERLAQIEQFSKAVLSVTPVEELIEMHASAHSLKSVSKQVKDAHDMISDELEVVHGLAEPYELPTVVKQAMLNRLDSGFVSKAAEYRYTLGPAYVPDREDAHGEFTDTVTLQAAMWDWVRKGDRTIYLQHSDKAAGEMVEMMTMPFPLEAELTVPGQGVTKYTFPADTPFLGVVWEEWAWDLVKSGQLRGYSIGGTAKRVEADLPVEATV